ncbi:unnamed protein product [[Actinomadura] parvosata subsp. kistnae]|uniref:Uncharacterized protein n=1 Tax=[Actinomadura] parvosata subsp. kistnae TaxID=1909395 RepID=A0A1U9ZXR5_9ACTN|nr:hypothetical protein [Nonomuraea sp. ATCC 55076]AQZ62742.1 hypothetical protein BKM31_15895 [Nonomuraea sp. ATCC 55076]SPL89477.1 unnamed protein product [Actinomadura parvosata subsp. kistnae]
MVQHWSISQVREVVNEHEDAWLIHYDPIDGDLRDAFVAYVPKEALEWRAAEFGLTTVDEALEVQLYLPLLAPGQAAGTLDMLNPSAMPVEQAHAHVTELLATCKKQHGVIQQPASNVRTGRADPLTVIRERTRIDVVRTTAMRLEIDRALLAREGQQEDN